MKEKLSALAKELEVEDRIIFLGTVTQEDLPRYFAISNVFVRPSRSEGLGSAFLEAMAGGLPVIATPVGGIIDFLKDKETGLFCEVDNPQSLANKIKLLLENRSLYNKLIGNAYKLIKDRYSWQKIADDYRIIFNKLV